MVLVIAAVVASPIMAMTAAAMNAARYPAVKAATGAVVAREET
jgi:hypothetical protein